jgi:multiple sugar transport system permease protein
MVGLLFISPLISVAISSVKTPAEASMAPPTYLPSTLSLMNFERLSLGGSSIWGYIANSAAVAVGTVGGTVIIATLAAFGLSRYRFRGSEVIFVAILTTIMVPFQIILTPIYIELQTLSLGNSRVGLTFIMITFQLPFAIFMIRNSFNTIPADIYDAAAVDGAGVWTSLRLVLPLVMPGLVTAAIFAFFAAWNEFFAPLILLADQDKFTLPVMLTTLTNGAYGSVDWGILQAGVVVTVLPCIVIFVILQRYYVRGLLGGSSK